MSKLLNSRSLLAYHTRGAHHRSHAKHSYSQSPTHQITLVRHGESTWNVHNLFTGWFDAPLTDKGISEAIEAGKALKKEDMRFDIVFTSKLTRTKETAKLIIENCEQKVKFVEDYRLNERHYGALTGYNKSELVRRFGKSQVRKWRYGYKTIPPAMTKDHPCFEAIKKSFPYSPIPKGESLKMVTKRAVEFWRTKIVPEIKCGKRVLIVTHNNTLRGFIYHLDNFCSKEIFKYIFDTGVPFTYTLDTYMQPIRNKRMQYLFEKKKCEC